MIIHDRDVKFIKDFTKTVKDADMNTIPWVDAYRTVLMSPSSELLTVLRELKDLSFAA